MCELHFRKPDRETAERRRTLTLEAGDACRAFSPSSALVTRTKQLLAVAVAHVTQCPWRFGGHAKAARRTGTSSEAIMETIWVAAEVPAGAGAVHFLKELDLMDDPEG